MYQNTTLSYEEAYGNIDYGMTNDYMFRAVLQENKIVLKGLICSLLHLEDHEVSSVEITNPIQLGKSIDAKTFVLDIHVMLNNNRIVNLEMQMTNLQNWQERSLSYLCRAFDQLNKGEDYSVAKPAIHIGFLNFSATCNTPEFYATYKLLNVKTQEVYSDKFILSVVDLTQIELATEEDKIYGVDLWARVFTATTWEEITMLAQNNEYLQEAVSGVRQLTEEEKIRQRCQARETNAYWERIRNAQTKQLKTDLANAQAELADTQGELANAQAELAVLNKELEELRAFKAAHSNTN